MSGKVTSRGDFKADGSTLPSLTFELPAFKTRTGLRFIGEMIYRSWLGIAVSVALLAAAFVPSHNSSPNDTNAVIYTILLLGFGVFIGTITVISTYDSRTESFWKWHTEAEREVKMASEVLSTHKFSVMRIGLGDGWFNFTFIDTNDPTSKPVSIRIKSDCLELLLGAMHGTDISLSFPLVTHNLPASVASRREMLRLWKNGDLARASVTTRPYAVLTAANFAELQSVTF